MPDSTEPVPNAPGSGRAWPDAVLAILVIAFAFLAASFTARNSDLWLHLATGRLQSEGQYHFGNDPFGYTTENVCWANHCWLADLAMYRGYTTLGGEGLVILKAVLIALTIALMLAAARGAGPSWTAAGTMLLAVLAMSPRLLLQPACASFLLLALCLWLFRRGGRAHVAIPIVIAVWVNLDDWFPLGPLLIALCSVGRWLSPSPDVPRPPVWLLPACLGVCLLSPYHVRGLTLPAELSLAVRSSDFAQDPRFASMFASSLHLTPIDNLSAWAFWILLGLGISSFAVNYRAARGWRGLAWLGFAFLACWQVRLVPFFAVIAGPITALNLREVVSTGFLSRSGRGLAGLFALVLIALTWPGWLQGFSTRDRGLAWAASPEPSLAHAAEVVKRWRANGTLPPEARTLATHPDLANHLAWFCPGEKVLMDSRFDLFAKVAPEFAAVSRMLGLVPYELYSSGGSRAGSIPDRSIACILLYDPDSRRMTTAIRAVAADREQWELLAVEGSTVFVRPTGTATGHRFAPTRQAFGAEDDDELPAAPVSGVALAAVPAAVWAVKNRPRRVAWQGDAAFVYLRLFEIEAGPQASGPSRDRSPALPILAARAARTAVAASPADDAAWLSLARSYMFQSRASWEADVGRGFPLLVHLRQIQVAAALVQAAIEHPEGVGAHDALAGLFSERGFFDLAVRHRREQVRLIRQSGPAVGEPREAFTERFDHLTAALEDAENALQDRENRFLVQTHGSAGDPLGRARTALRLGLAARAIDVLATSHADLYGADGLRLLLELLLWTGQAADARALLDRDEIRGKPDMLGMYEIAGGIHDGWPWGYQFHAYDWFDFCQSASAGRYAAASGAAQRLRSRLKAQEAVQRRRVTPQAAYLVASQAGLAANMGGVWALPLAASEREAMTSYLASIGFLAAARADLHTLEGLLHLERGATEGAAEQFGMANRVYTAEAGSARVRPGQLLAERYAAAIRETAR